MPGYYDETDVAFGWSGDFSLDKGDLKTTESDGLQSLKEQLHIVCSSSLGDWEIYPNKGADLDDFIGESNTRETGERIRERVMLSIIGAELVNADDLEVRVLPVSLQRVLIVIKIHALPTPFNELTDGQILQTSLVFDSVEKQMFVLDRITPSSTSNL